jgi:hypothetical protein
MNANQVLELQRRQEAATRDHDALRNTFADMGMKRQHLHARLGSEIKGSHRRNEVLREIENLDAARSKVKSALDEAQRIRQRADVALQVALSARFGQSVAPSAPAQFNSAQLEHLKLLAVRVRSPEMKAASRLRAAVDFVSVVESMFLRVP